MILEHGQDEQSAKLLAKANLFRIRRQWDEAVTCCMHVLYHSPENWSAHALLGDIYADQDRAEEAIQWYCMTLDIRSDAQSVRDKLSQIVNSRRHQIVHAIDPTRPYTARDGRTFPAGPFGRLAWYLSAPERRRIGWTAAVIIAIAALIATPLILNRHTSTASGAIFTGGSTPTNPAILFQPVPPESKNGGAPTESTTSTQTTAGGAVPTAAPPATPPDSASPLRDPTDQAITDALSSDQLLRAQGIQVADAQLQPATNALTVTFVSTGPPAPTLQARELRDCAYVARSSFALAAAVTAQSCTLRCLAEPVQTGQIAAAADSPTQSPTLSFSGAISRDNSAVQTDPSTLSLTQLAGLFTDTWWRDAASPPS